MNLQSEVAKPVHGMREPELLLNLDLDLLHCRGGLELPPPEEEDMRSKILSLTLILLAVPLLAWGERYAFSAFLNGTAVVPPVKTEAFCGARFDFTPDGKSMRFRLSVQKLINPKAAHIYLGAAGKEGPAVVTLYPFDPAPRMKEGNVAGILALGVITAANLEGPLKGKPLSDLIKEIQSGNAYVQIQTAQHPQGELRGQIARRPT
jgi:hypothetical protein